MAQATTRIILLGGSNLSRGISAIVGSARLAAGGPADFHIAMGHGRSYGMQSAILGRSLPGILECGLWDAVSARPAPTTLALVTDIGNDVGYGVDVPTIAGWVEQCLDRLAAAGARTVMTRLPVESLRRLSPWRFRLARSIFYPGRPLEMSTALDRVRRLDDRLGDLGRRDGVRLISQDPAWYGLDPIHIRRRLIGPVWAGIMAAWSGDGGPVAAAPGSPWRWLGLKTATPRQWWLLGRRLGRPQPARRWGDGTTISLF